MFADQSHVHLKNVSSGGTLRFNGRVITGNGGFGKAATWKIHVLGQEEETQIVKLQSVARPQKFLKIAKNGVVTVGKGGKWCVFVVKQLENGNITLASRQKGLHVGFEADGSIKPANSVGEGEHAQFVVPGAEGEKEERQKRKNRRRKRQERRLAAMKKEESGNLEEFFVKFGIEMTDSFWNFNFKKVNNSDCQWIAQGLREAQVQDISFRASHLTDEGITLIAEALKENTSLTTLRVRNCPLHAQGAEALAEAFKVNSTLTTIDLSHCHFGPEGAEFLAQGLSENKSITKIFLVDNGFSCRGAEAIANLIAANTSIAFMRLQRNHMGEAGMEKFIPAIEQNCNLHTLGFKGNRCSRRVIKTIHHLLRPQAIEARREAMGEGDLSRGLAEQKKINILIKGATGLKETDDALVKFEVGRESYSTETTQDAESPSWEENFEVSVTHPDEESVLFSVWDEDGDEEEEGDGAPLLLGVCSASLGGLELGDEKALCLPFRHGAREGVLNVILKALNYSTTDDDDDDGGENMGGGGEASEGALEERNALRAEVRELKNINKRLAAEIHSFSAENERYSGLNEKLKANVDNLDGEIGDLRTEVSLFARNNEKLEANVSKLTEENAQLEATREALQADLKKMEEEVANFTTQNDRLQGEVDNLASQNDLLEKTREGLDEGVEQMREENKKMAASLVELGATEKALARDVERLGGEVERMTEENVKLTEVRKGLEDQVTGLGDEVAKMGEENKRLEEVREKLGMEVAGLGNKLNVLEGEMKNLSKTREMLDEQVRKQAEQNIQLKQEMSDLSSIQESMKALADEQGADYQAFIDQLNDSIRKNEELLDDFQAENEDLKETRKQMTVDSYMTLSNSFAMWDCKIGLDAMEFESYMMMLGEDFEKALAAKFGGDKDAAFAALDTDGSGTLNMQELREVIQQLVDDLEDEDDGEDREE